MRTIKPWPEAGLMRFVVYEPQRDNHVDNHVVGSGLANAAGWGECVLGKRKLEETQSDGVRQAKA